jgi:hypothetical protein
MEIHFTSNSKNFKAVFETFSKKEIDKWKTLIKCIDPFVSFNKEILLKE